MKIWEKLVALFIGSALLAGLIGGLANALDLGLASVYGLGGALIALVVAFGVRWIFGLDRVQLTPLKPYAPPLNPEPKTEGDWVEQYETWREQRGYVD